MKIRPPQVAGYFYPAEREKLKKVVGEFLENAKNLNLGKIHALLCPHAGYTFCGEVAGWSYKQIENLDYNQIFILASNHSYAAYAGASVPEFEYYETPLGKVKVSSITKELMKNNLFTSIEEAHLTHVVEVQLPFLQLSLKKFEIVPIVLSMTTEEEQKELSKIIENYLNEKTLIIISSDLSHYYPYEKAVELDNSCLKAIEKQDIEETKNQQACGLEAILTILHMAKKLKWNSKLLAYKNSGDTSGNKIEVVGYGSVAFFS